MAKIPFKPDQSPSDVPALNDDDREAQRQQEAKDALRRSFEHGAPETGPGDDLDIERDV